MGDVLVIGVGNRERSDDALGPLVLDALAAAGLSGHESLGDPGRLMDVWQGRDSVVVIDAVDGAGPPGTVIEWTADGTPLPEPFAASTHALGIGSAVGLAETLGRMPARLTLLGVQGERWGFGHELSRAVAAALPKVVRRVRELTDA